MNTRAALEGAGFTVVDLPVLTDVDHWPEAVEVAALCPEGSRMRRTVEEIALAL
ncbi:hypothetical protein ACFQX8_28635 [Klenkia terrae]|uniref:hypothetical protein n=1 Tax=Klenkia terrae TaxID=1052259 RepID=UPI0036150AB6